MSDKGKGEDQKITLGYGRLKRSEKGIQSDQEQSLTYSL